MKSILLAGVIVGTVFPTQAQLFSREALGGAALGGLAGGIIGHNSGRHTGEGIAIGAGVGLLLGALTADARRDRYDYYASPRQGYYERPNYAVAGTVLGGIAGGVIGHNSHGRTGAGIAIGAGAGLLLGAVAESEARRHEAIRTTLQPTYVVMTQPATVLSSTTLTQAPSEQTATQTVLSTTEPRSTMSSANALFGR